MERYERPRPRPYLVNWNEGLDKYSSVGWKSRAELEALMRSKAINWIQMEGEEPLNRFELTIYQKYLELYKPEEGIVPGNKEIAEMISTEENTISRNDISRARRRIAHKLGFDAGW